MSGGGDFDILTALVSDVRKGKVFYGAGSKQPLTGALEEMAGQVIQPGTTLQTAGKILTGNISAAAIPSSYKRYASGSLTTSGTRFVIRGLAFKPQYVFGVSRTTASIHVVCYCGTTAIIAGSGGYSFSDILFTNNGFETPMQAAGWTFSAQWHAIG